MSKKKQNNVKQVEHTLDLIKEHLIDMIEHPEKLDRIPDQATVVLIPVPVKTKKAA